jgi:hypothetical protein
MRFTIRDLLWLTLLAAVLVAWWVDRGRLARRIEALERNPLLFWGDIDTNDP